MRLPLRQPSCCRFVCWQLQQDQGQPGVHGRIGTSSGVCCAEGTRARPMSQQEAQTPGIHTCPSLPTVPNHRTRAGHVSPALSPSGLGQRAVPVGNGARPRTRSQIGRCHTWGGGPGARGWQARFRVLARAECDTCWQQACAGQAGNSIYGGKVWVVAAELEWAIGACCCVTAMQGSAV